jgi:predicted nucleic acid-binding Zn ribbon protein
MGVTDGVGAACNAVSRNALLEADLEAWMDGWRNQPPALASLARAFEGDLSDEEHEARAVIRWIERSSYRCSSCQHVFVDGDVIHRLRRHEFESSLWSHRAYCEKCVSSWHPSWLEHRREPFLCPGGCGARVSFWGWEKVVSCSRRCQELLERERRRVRRDERPCEECGRAFAPRRADGRFCSSACRQRAYRARRREI